MSKIISEATMQKLLELIRADLGNKVNGTELETMLDAYVTTVGLSEILDGYATDTELANGLATKSDTGHKHVKADITDFKESDYAPSSHTHEAGDINMLQSMLANKSQVGHTHKISDVENLQTTLDGKASSTHTHEISDVTNLQTSLNNKSDTGHTHDMLDIDGLTETLGNIHSFDVQVVSSLPSVGTAVERTIYFVPKTDTDTDNVYNEYLLINGAFELIGDTQVDLTNYVTTDKLTTELAKKANETHTHEIVDVTNLQTTLDTKMTKLSAQEQYELACAENGKVLIAKVKVYDSNITIDISSTTNVTYSGKLVIACQNYYIQSATLFGDDLGTLKDKLVIIESNNDDSTSENYRAVSIYCNFDNWSKNIVKLEVVSGVKNPIVQGLQVVDTIPTTNLYQNFSYSSIIDDVYDVLFDGGSDTADNFSGGEDLNDYKTRQVIFSRGSNITSTLLNCPATNKAGRLEVMEMYSSNDVVQRWIRRDGVEEWSRNYSDGVWSSWNKTIKESDLVEQSNLYYCNEEKVRTYDSVNLTFQVGTKLTIDGTDDGTGDKFYSPTPLNIPLTVGVDYEMEFKVLSGTITYAHTSSDYITVQLNNGDSIANYLRCYSADEFLARRTFTATQDTITQVIFNFPQGMVFDNAEVEMFIRRCSYVRTATNSVDTIEAGQIKLGNYTIVNNGTNDTLDITYNGA